MTTRILLRLALLALLAVQVAWILRDCGDRPFVYVLDDPYIHLTLARNLATTGILGVNPGQWSSASSSPAWTAMLAGLYLVAGDQLLAPLVLNLLLAAALVWWLVDFLLRAGYAPLTVAVLGVGFLFLVPLIPLAFTGMEHLLHLALVLALVISTVKAADGRTSPAWPIGLALVATAVRYESLFVIAGLAGFLLLTRHWRLGLGLVAAGLGVIALFAAVYVAHGESPLPNTFLVKALSTLPGESWLTARLLRLAHNALNAPGLSVLLVAAAGWAISARRQGRRQTPPLPVPPRWSLGLGGFALAALLHLTLASVGWFFRYEAYLIGLGIFLLMWALAPTAAPTPANSLCQAARKCHPYPGRTRNRQLQIGVVLLLAVLAVLPGFRERATAIAEVPAAMREVYHQQYQLARFVREYYNGAAVGLNDIGVVSYYTQARVVDLVGLASYPLAAARARGPVTAEMVDQFARAQGVQVALVYTDWLRRGPPASWRLVGTWTTPGARVAVGGETIGFYALAAPPEALRRQLQDFAPRLPPGVSTNLHGSSH